MAEPFGVPAGRVSSDVPGVIPGGPRPLPPSPELSKPTEAGASDGKQPKDAAKAKEQVPAEPEATAVPVGEGEEVIDLSDEDRAAVPTRSDDQSGPDRPV